MDGSRFAPRDPQVEAAMEALGVGRRDAITSATMNGKETREERYYRLNAAREAEERTRTREAAAASGNETAQRISAWYNSSNITPDAAALASENIANGQSHRAQLRAAIASGQIRDDDEELEDRRPARRPNRDAGSGNYVAQAGSTSSRPAAATVPRKMQSATLPTSSSTGGATPSRPDGHVRPPSPRSQGTVRIGPGGLKTQRPAAATTTGGAVQPPRPAPASSSTVTRPATAASTALRAPSSAMSANPTHVPAASSEAPHLAKASSVTPASHTTPAQVSPAVTPSAVASKSTPSSAASTSAARPSSASSASVPSTTYQEKDPYVRRALQGHAMWAVANPGSVPDATITAHPNAQAYLQGARKYLVREATDLAKAMDEKEIMRYTQLHKERKWMVAAAIKARELVEHGTDEELEAHYAANVAHRDFAEEAVKLYDSPRWTMEASTPPAAVVTPAPKSSLSATTPSTAAAVQPSKQHVSRAEPDGVASAARPATSSTLPVRSTMADLAAQVVASSGTSAKATGTSSLSTTRIRTNGPVPATSSSAEVPLVATNGPPAQVNGTAQASRAVNTAQPTPTSSLAQINGAVHQVRSDETSGTLNVVYYDHLNNFVGHEQLTVSAPMNMTLSITSTAAAFKPETVVTALRSVHQVEINRNKAQSQVTPRDTPQASPKPAPQTTPTVAAHAAVPAAPHIVAQAAKQAAPRHGPVAADDGVYDSDGEL